MPRSSVFPERCAVLFFEHSLDVKVFLWTSSAKRPNQDCVILSACLWESLKYGLPYKKFQLNETW